jgi:ABC-type glycerol-3-phosphate transport system permease component
MSRRRRKLTPGKIAALTFQYFTLILASILVLLPLWSLIISSFKPAREYLETDRITPPQNWFNVSNYIEAIWPEQANGITIGQAFYNTGFILVFSLIFLILLGSSAAFVIDRFRFRGRGVILGAWAVVVAVPGILTPVSTFQVLKLLGLANSKWALVVLYCGVDIVSILIFVQFLKSISTEIDDSARIEGANYFQIFFRLILPMLTPAIATVVILRTVGIYNDFVTPYLYVPQQQEATVSMMLYNMAGFNSGTSQAVLLAAIVLVILPTVVGFFILQRYIYAGITNGSVKG